jgi:hypothetical protein
MNCRRFQNREAADEMPLPAPADAKSRTIIHYSDAGYETVALSRAWQYLTIEPQTWFKRWM